MGWFLIEGDIYIPLEIGHGVVRYSTVCEHLLASYRRMMLVSLAAS